MKTNTLTDSETQVRIQALKTGMDWHAEKLLAARAPAGRMAFCGMARPAGGKKQGAKQTENGRPNKTSTSLRQGYGAAGGPAPWPSGFTGRVQQRMERTFGAITLSPKATLPRASVLSNPLVVRPRFVHNSNLSYSLLSKSTPALHPVALLALNETSDTARPIEIPL